MAIEPRSSRRAALLAFVLAAATGALACHGASTAHDVAEPNQLTDDASTDAGAAPVDASTEPCDAASSGTGCSGTPTDGGATDGGAVRDWHENPALVDLPSAETILALSDVHGGYERVTKLLVAGGVLAEVPSHPPEARWAGGSATLLVLGDLIDKGPSNLDVIDFFMALEADARTNGGRVVVTLGNHEAEFFVDPTNKKAAREGGFSAELEKVGLSPVAVAAGNDARGAWLRSRPFGVRVGRFFFSHAGDTGGRSMAELETVLEAAVEAHPDYDDPAIVGADSILESREWYEDTATARANATALGVRHIVFGHDPSALGPKGKIAVAQENVLVRIDCGMSPDVDYSKGMLLRVVKKGTDDVVEQIDASGKTKALFTSPKE